MAMDIKRDEPLSPAARQYLADRNQFDLIKQIDENYPPKAGSTAVYSQAYGSPGGTLPPTGVENLSNEALLEEIRRRQRAGEDFGEDVSVSVSGDDYEDDDAPYEDWTKAELDDELSKRVGPDGKPLARGGSNVEKAGRLRANDAWMATQSKPL